MAIANYFYNSTTRKYVALFGTLFNQLKIQRHDNAGVLKKEMIVPLAYAPYQKILARVTADPDLINSRRPAMTLPRMSFEINNISYDPQRKLTTTGKMIKRGKSETDDARPYVYNPVPYNLDFSLYIMTKYSEDATKILEQIIPFFTPDWTVGAKMIPDLDPIDIPIVLNSVTIEDLYEGAFDERQMVLHTLTFTLRGYYFGPEKTKKIIKFVDVDMFNGTDTNSPFLEGIDIRPGLSSANTPITDVGETATAVSALTTGSVSSISLTNDGENYNANTVVTIGAPDVANADITSTITNGAVSDITINDGGGYFSNLPTVSVGLPDSPITTATATATLSGDSVANVSISNPGNFYTNPTFSIAPPPNVAAEFKFGDDALAHSSENDVTTLHSFSGYFNSNTGYKVSFWIYPTSFPGGNNPMSVLFAPFTKIFFTADTGNVRFQYGGAPVVTSDTDLVLNQWNHVEVEHYTNLIRINVNGLYGTQETRGAGNVAFPGHTYRAGDAQGNESVFDGANRSFLGYLDNVTWETTGDMPTASSGDPYTIPTTARTGDLFTKNFDKDLPVATITATDGEVISIDVTSGGSGYATAPAVTIDAPDDTPSTFAASLTPTLVNGVIDSITINSSGKFYANAPAINVSAPTSTQATAIANVGNNGDIQSITITDAGLGYRNPPAVTISSPDFGSIPYQDIEFDDNWGIIKTIVSE